MDLFRKEAVDFKKQKLVGEVTIHVPVKYAVIIAVFFMIIVISLVFLFTQTYTQKVRVEGHLVPSLGLKNVYSERSAVIDRILVSIGDKVSVGQELVHFDTNMPLVDGSLMSTRMSSAIENESNLLTEKISSTLSTSKLRVKNLESSHKLLLKEIDFIKNDILVINEAIEIKEEQLEMLTNLNKKDLEPRAMLLAERLQHKEYIRRLSNLKLELARKVSESENTDLKISIEKENSKDIVNTYKINGQGLELRKINLMAQAGYVKRSTVDGIVTAVFEKPGNNVLSNKVILSIMPTESELIGRLEIPSRAIGFISAGEQVKIHYDAFPYQKYGMFNGEISRVSKSIISPREYESSVTVVEPVFLVDIDIDAKSVKTEIGEISLLPGMKLIADISVDNNTLFEIFTAPIRRFKTGKME